MRVHVGIGSNLGDRQANVLSALQRLRARCSIAAVSAFYESPAIGGARGPDYLNVAAAFDTAMNAGALEQFLRDVERSVGRTAGAGKLAPRPIDIDVLAIDGVVVRADLERRPYDAVPLAEIAPELSSARPNGRIRKRTRSLHFSADRQSDAPTIGIALDRAGVSGVRRLVRLDVDGRERLYLAEFSMVADLQPDRSGVHMSRFSEILEAATLDVLERPDAPARAERLAEAIAREIVASQRAVRAEVRLRAQFALERWTPVSGKRGEETYVMYGIAGAGPYGVRRLTGVEAEGMTACPCAQAMMREHAQHELIDAGFSADDARRALDALPAATHNQRGRGTLIVGAGRDEDAVRVEDLVEIVENSMSSETYDLLKRPDEFFIVNKAHHNPKFVEDVVRSMIAGALDVYADFSGDAFVFASQVNDESIHKHDAFAEAFGSFGEFRDELRGTAAARQKTSLERWLMLTAEPSDARDGDG